MILKLCKDVIILTLHLHRFKFAERAWKGGRSKKKGRTGKGRKGSERAYKGRKRLGRVGEDLNGPEKNWEGSRKDREERKELKWRKRSERD